MEIPSCDENKLIRVYIYDLTAVQTPLHSWTTTKTNDTKFTNVQTDQIKEGSTLLIVQLRTQDYSLKAVRFVS